MLSFCVQIATCLGFLVEISQSEHFFCITNFKSEIGAQTVAQKLKSGTTNPIERREHIRGEGEGVSLKSCRLGGLCWWSLLREKRK
ncbi:hypothetical protein L6452_38994 [Arctium lappa]|uniref:Uncharacterized protein n=1 Tax=Arctium lappa TaxID=4217 RepID=A0ACB8XRM6_ARCLA|nr:hypothetical protein L6452_38994 [Arctium lappa]